MSRSTDGRHCGRRGWRSAGLTTALLLLLPGVQAIQAQEPTGNITGIVTSQAGDPVPNAQVTVVGTQRGTLTDQRGRFLLTGVQAGEREVRVSSVGYRSASQTVQVEPEGSVTVEIRLDVSAVALDEVVVTGTVGGTQRRSLGNVVTAIRAADAVDMAPIRDMQSLLNARAPGVVITPGTGMVGSGSQVRVRGSSSFSLSNTPLLYVDGVRVDNAQNTGPAAQAFGSSVISRLNDFDPDDIESIEIIKGPAAATLYGTEAANGVIQIITKRGQAGAPTWNMTVRQGANWFDDAEDRIPTNFWRNPDTDQVESINLVRSEREFGQPIWRTGHIQNYSLSLNGGSSDVRYHLSGNFDDEQGADWDNDLRRVSGRANINVAASDELEIEASMGYTSARVNLACEAGCGGVTWASIFSTPAHAQADDRRRGARSFTPEAYWGITDRFQELGRFTGSLQLTHRPASWFQQRLTFGLDDTGEDNQTVTEINEMLREWSPTSQGGKSVGRREVTNRTLDYSGTVSLPINDRLTSNTSVGGQYYSRLLKSVSASGSEFALPGLRVIDATNPDERSSSESFVESVSLGVFAQQEFNWEDRLFLTAGLRADDHSAFGENFELVYYPKISAAWVISEEPFWNVGPISELRLRTAFGRAGEQPGAFDALRTFSAVAGPDGPTVTPGSVGNPDLGPEKGEEFEIGFDAGLLNDRAGLEFTYYNQRTRDAILLQPVAPSSGFPGSRFINAGELRNFGFEMTLDAEPVRSGNVAWEATFSLARNDSEVIDIGDQDEISVGFGVTHKPGFPVAGWHHRRVVDAEFDEEGSVIQSSMVCDDGEGGTTPCFNEEGQIVAPDVFLGRSQPLWEGAFSSSVTLWDRVRVYGLMDFKSGFMMWDHVTRVRCALFNICEENVRPQDFVDRDPALLASYQNADNFGDAYINDAGFMKLREVSLTYFMPDDYAQRVGASRASISLAARNLATWTDWTGIEPESRFLGGARGLHGGLEQNHLPQVTSFVASVNVTF